MLNQDILEMINSKKTPKGGWTKEVLSSWGVPWPPPKGWKNKMLLEGFRKENSTILVKINKEKS